MVHKFYEELLDMVLVPSTSLFKVCLVPASHFVALHLDPAFFCLFNVFSTIHVLAGPRIPFDVYTLGEVLLLGCLVFAAL